MPLDVLHPIAPVEDLPQTDRSPAFAELQVPMELAPFVRELGSLYERGERVNVLRSLQGLLLDLQAKTPPAKPTEAATVYPTSAGEGGSTSSDTSPTSSFLKSWQDILDLEVYVDTDIYCEIDRNLPVESPPPTIAHEAAAAAYAASWSEIAEHLARTPDDLFLRAWGTTELARFLGIPAERLRRARRSNQLPLIVGGYAIDCVELHGHPGHRRKLLWQVRPDG